MAGGGAYKRILSVLERLPVDPSKSGRDLGPYLKGYIKRCYKEGKFQEHGQYWDRQYIALQKIADNENQKKYKRILTSSATGLTAEQCNIALSNEFLEQLRQEDKSFLIFMRKCSTQIAEGIQNIPHIPVMVDTVLKYLKPSENQVLLDMTFGAGGHSQKILESAPNIKLLTLDRDPTANEYMEKLKQKYPNQVVPLLGKFSDLPKLLTSHQIFQNSLDGILFDFGCSSMQFDEAERGFSLSKQGPLDMRMDRCPETPTAADILAKATEEDIAKIIKVYGEEKYAKKIARAIIEARYLFRRLNTTGELADLVDSVCCEEKRIDKLQRYSHSATKTFQALRIFVNNELNEINYGLVLAQKYLKIGGRIVTISFHSLEDTIVKRHLLGNVIQNTANQLPLKYSSHNLSLPKDTIEELMESNWQCLHKHVILPSADEIENNPRSRSAKLRAAIRVK